jgi:hypothetical protein
VIDQVEREDCDFIKAEMLRRQGGVWIGIGIGGPRSRDFLGFESGDHGSNLSKENFKTFSHPQFLLN